MFEYSGIQASKAKREQFDDGHSTEPKRKVPGISSKTQTTAFQNPGEKLKASQSSPKGMNLAHVARFHAQEEEEQDKHCETLRWGKRKGRKEEAAVRHPRMGPWAGAVSDGVTAVTSVVHTFGLGAAEIRKRY